MKRFAVILALLACPGAASAEELLTVKGAATVKETLDRMETAAKADGFVIVVRVDHAANAEKAGLPLRPTALLVFGKAKGGTPVIQCDQRIGIDLPLRALAWQDEAGQVWLGMADPAVLKARYGLPAACDAPLAAMQGAVRALLGRASQS
jgi:uncharacterized protein (DUF302 family)